MSIQLKRNDTKDVIGYKLTYPNNSAVNLTGASVRFVMGRGNKLITNAAAKIVNASAGEVEYTLTEADTLEAGVFHAEFEVTFSNGKVKTFPNNGYINMHIQANLDSDQSTYIEDQIAYRVSDIQILKKEIQAQIDQAVINGDSSVEAAQARVESDGTTNVTLKARLDKKEAEFSQGIETLTTELAQKASKEEARLKSVKLNPEDLSEETLGLVTGTGTVNLETIPQNDSVDFRKLKNGIEGLITKGKNLLNVNDENFQEGYYLGSTGNPYANANAQTSGFIEVIEGDALTFSIDGTPTDVGRWVAYDSNKVFVSGSMIDYNGTYFTPVGATYVRVSSTKLLNAKAQIEKGSTPSSYQQYGYNVNSLNTPKIHSSYGEPTSADGKDGDVWLVLPSEGV